MGVQYRLLFLKGSTDEKVRMAHQALNLYSPYTEVDCKIRIPNRPGMAGQSQNWPLPSRVPDWLEFVPESRATANWHHSQVHNW